MNFANPTMVQILEAAESLQWRKCWHCYHVALHVDSVTPWVNCHKCGSQDTRLMRRETDELMNGRIGKQAKP